MKDYVYIYDGVPLYPGFSSSLYPGLSSSGATLLATLCGSNVDHTLTVSAQSGIMTVFFEAVVDLSSMSHTHALAVCCFSRHTRAC